MAGITSKEENFTIVKRVSQDHIITFDFKQHQIKDGWFSDLNKKEIDVCIYLFDKGQI